MRNAQKLVVFCSSFFLTLGFLVIISNFFSYLIPKMSNLTMWTIYSFTFYFFIFTHGLLRKLFINKRLSGSKLFATGKVNKFTFREKSWLYLGPILIYFLPNFKSRSFSNINMYLIIMFILTIIILELLLLLSQKSILVYFTDQGIFINGLDLRFFVPKIYGSVLHNDSGFYKYSDFKNYYKLENQIDLYENLDQGKLEIISTKDELIRIQGVLTKQKIKVKKFN